MQFAGIFHKTSEQMSYALNENELIVNLRTGYDVRRVFIHYGDPFESGILGGNEKWTGKREEICFKKRLRHQLWWTTTLVPKYKRCKYYFELHTEEEVWYYFEDGFLTEEQMQQFVVLYSKVKFNRTREMKANKAIPKNRQCDFKIKR